MRRKRRVGPPEVVKSTSERWLVSYADMITLLFCLFLVLYAMSKVNEQKFQVLSRSLSRALDKSIEPALTLAPLPTPSPTAKVDQRLIDNAMKEAELRAHEEKVLEDISHRLGDLLTRNGWHDKVHAHVEEAGLVVTLVTDGLMFATGDAELRTEGIPIILAIAQAVKPFPNPIRVEGHTDNVPLHGGPYKTNWGLSTMRATSVAEVLIRGGRLDPRRISVLGYGETRPKVANDTPARRQLNRRVEILVLRRGEAWSTR